MRHTHWNIYKHPFCKGILYYWSILINIYFAMFILLIYFLCLLIRLRCIHSMNIYYIFVRIHILQHVKIVGRYISNVTFSIELNKELNIFFNVTISFPTCPRNISECNKNFSVRRWRYEIWFIAVGRARRADRPPPDALLNFSPY